MTKRLFVAISLPSSVRDKISIIPEELRKIGADLNIVSLENLHLSLKFLGEVSEEKMSFIDSALLEIRFPPFRIRLEGVGVFPGIDNIKVIWIGVKSAEVRQLIKEINLKLDVIRKEEREENCHLTLGRVKSERKKKELQEFVKKNENTFFAEFEVKDFVLLSSELTPMGPIYTKVGDYLLVN